MNRLSLGIVSFRGLWAGGVALGLFVLVTPRASAAPFTTNFAPLIAELQERAGGLSNSLDKVEQKQCKTIVKVLAAFNKPATSLATDLKTAGKVAKTLVKAFPDDFATNAPTAVVFGVVVTDDLSDLLDEAFDAFEDDVLDEIDALTDLIAGLPDGSAKTKATAALVKAQLAFSQATAVTDYASKAKYLSSALKSALAGQAAATKGSGGGSGDILKATVVNNGTNLNWVADSGAFGGEWVMGSGILDIGGTRGGISGTQLSVALCSGFNGQPGTYALGNACGGFLDFVNSGFYLASTGSLQIVTFDSGAGTASGTFWYEASDGGTTILVTNGMFNISNLFTSN